MLTFSQISSLQTSRQPPRYCRTVFTCGLNEEILMEQPETVKDCEHPIRVCRSKKSLHSQEQAEREGYIKINDTLLKFKRCQTDNCVYVS